MVPSGQSSQDTWSARRRAAWRRAHAEKQVSALLVSRREDVGYLCGFTGEDSWLLLGRQWACLVTDGRFDEQARIECPGIEVHMRGSAAMSAAVVEKLKGRGVRRLGVQGDHLSLAQYEALSKALPGRRIVQAGDSISGLRTIKDERELRAIRRAIAVAEAAFKRLIARGAKGFVGRTEREIAAELEYLMCLAGAERAAFETILAVGPHASLCHYRPGDTRVRRGDPVLIDWGAMVDGYCSDLTRVVFVGKIPPKLAEIYEVVRRAQRAGINAIRPGASVRTVDAAARKVIERAGYGDRFVHGLGHGVGRQVHESPGLARTGKGRLKAGMVLTVEPGIYLPGVGGVRIEDDVLVIPGGRRRLTTLPTDLPAMLLT